MTPNERFQQAVNAALSPLPNTGLHGSIGTQNERTIHAALKNYYAPYSDEQEIRIGSYYADAVCEDGIFEIQTSGLYRLSEKLSAFLEFSRVTVVHPVIRRSLTRFISSDSGEITGQTPARNLRSNLGVFEELYSIRGLLNHPNLRVILADLSVEKLVYHTGDIPPDIRSKSARRRCVIRKLPVELLGETVLEAPADYRVFLPENLPETFTKKQLCDIAGESRSSLRTEVLRTVGLIQKVGKIRNEFLYSANGEISYRRE